LFIGVIVLFVLGVAALRRLTLKRTEEMRLELQGNTLVVHLAANIQIELDLSAVLEARTSDVTSEDIGLILTYKSGESFQHYFTTAHHSRVQLVEFINPHVQKSNANA
jgi:hypothetical protein